MTTKTEKAEAFANLRKRVGTAHFVSKAKAVRYYRECEVDARAAVERKLSEGSIHIGPPTLKPGERLTTIDGGTRYAVEGSV